MPATCTKFALALFLLTVLLISSSLAIGGRVSPVGSHQSIHHHHHLQQGTQTAPNDVGTSSFYMRKLGVYIRKGSFGVGGGGISGARGGGTSGGMSSATPGARGGTLVGGVGASGAKTVSSGATVLYFHGGSFVGCSLLLGLLLLQF
ncbi:hypothetical protein SAY86_026553 [Trapa natans]|uniref:Uncharacterized protein n=1 Tax=Trapa natans TaxID=22666 RepID=A0AAN7KB11_TRANT|nr:hypothetical protein SAY86_026553 [Trapa natans]